MTEWVQVVSRSCGGWAAQSRYCGRRLARHLLAPVPSTEWQPIDALSL
jgi:hypothetical protein